METWSSHKTSERQAALDLAAQWLVHNHGMKDLPNQGRESRHVSEEASTLPTRKDPDGILQQASNSKDGDSVQGVETPLHSLWKLLAGRVKDEQDEDVLCRTG